MCQPITALGLFLDARLGNENFQQQLPRLLELLQGWYIFPLAQTWAGHG